MKRHLCCHLQLQRSLKILMSRYFCFRPWLSRLYHPAVQRVSPSYQVSCLLWVRGNQNSENAWRLGMESSSAHGLPIVVLFSSIFRIRALMLLGKVTSRLSLHLESQCFTAYSILQNYFWICPWFFWWKAVDYRIREQFILVSKWPWGLPKRISFSRNLVLDLGQAYCGLNRFWIATHSTSFSCSLPGMLKVKCIEILLFLYLWYFLLQD